MKQSPIIKLTMAKPLAEYLINRIYEDDLPIHAETGRSYIDANGTAQMDVCLETEDRQLLDDILQEGINQLFF